MNYKIALIKGDGIGPEVVGEAIKVMDAIGGYTEVDPLNARRLEKLIQHEIQGLLEAFVVAGVTEFPKGRNVKH